MLYEFQKKVKKLSLGKRKLLLNKMNAYIQTKKKEDSSELGPALFEALGKSDDAREQFIYAASLLLDGKKTLKKTQDLLKKTFSVTSEQYEYYFAILDSYEQDLTDSGRKSFNSNTMGQALSKKTFMIHRSKTIRQKD